MIETIFESEKIIFCKVSYDLIDDYLTMVNDDNINKYISKNPQHYTKEEEMQWLKNELEKSSVIFSMIDKKSHKFIGNIELRDVDSKLHTAELGICITASMVNKGYGTEAITAIIKYGFEILELNTISLAVYSFNLRAIHCYEKLGFIKCNTHFNVGTNNSVPFDEYIMTISKQSFAKSEKRYNMITDCAFTKENKWFRYRAGAIIIENGCVLFAKNELDPYLYSVGGGIHHGETSEEAVIREVFEETGVHYEIDRLAFIHENFFTGSGTISDMDCHEISFYYLMKPRGTHQLGAESCNHTTANGIAEQTCWIPIEKLSSYTAFPLFLRDEIHNLDNNTVKHIVTDERCQ